MLDAKTDGEERKLKKEIEEKLKKMKPLFKIEKIIR